MSESVVETAPAVIEPVVPQAVEHTPKPEQSLDAQFLELQRRDKEVRVQKNKIKQEIESAKQTLLNDIRANPMAKLQELGINPDVLAGQFLNAPPPPTADDRVSQLERKLADRDAAEKTARENEALAAYDREMFAVVEKDNDSFELVNNHKDGRRLYKEAVYAYWREYGEAPNLEILAKHVEAELETDAKKLMGLKKLSPKKQAEAVADAAVTIAADAKKDAAPKNTRKTLNNGLTASTAPQVKYVGVKDPAAPHTSAFAQFQAERQAKLAESFAKLKASKG